MPLPNLPLLPNDYPIFDWNNWPKSYAALVPGGSTKKFEKECWNALVDALGNAVRDAGLEWRGGLETPEDAKIKNNPAMLARYMNSVISASENIIQIPWRWQEDESFRGYTGRRYFYSGIDTVYPEYFLELAHHINLLIGLLSGSLNKYVSPENCNLSTNPDADLVAGKSGIIQNQIYAKTKLSLPSGSLAVGNIYDFPKAKLFTAISKPQAVYGSYIPEARVLCRLPILLNGNVSQCKNISIDHTGRSGQIVSVEFLRELIEISGIAKFKSFSSVNIEKSNPISFSGTAKTYSNTAAQIENVRFISETAEQRTKSNVIPPRTDLAVTGATPKTSLGTFSSADIFARSAEEMPVESQTTAKSQALAEANRGITKRFGIGFSSANYTDIVVESKTPINFGEKAKTAISKSIDVQMHDSAPVFTQKKSTSKIVCNFEMVQWNLPVFVNGGLLIRQAYFADQRDNGVLEVR